eukprot:m.389852 g.389852  ORF g.389852 m.389852 type:complete len:367 (+) comp21055_c0_seq1:170-1270(+)
MLRVSKRGKLRERISQLDAFPKVEQEVQQKSSSGGFVTLIAVTAILILVISEFLYYRGVDVKYHYAVDKDFRREMRMTLDITIAMKCAFLGADFINLSGASMDMTKEHLQMEPTHFELEAPQQTWYDLHRRGVNSSDAERFDSLERFLRVSDTPEEKMPTSTRPVLTEGDSEDVAKACRIHGSIPIGRVAANFHITAGKSIHHARGHAHRSDLVPTHELNFSHRIDRLAFSDEAVGVHTLDGNLRHTNDAHIMFQYFLKVVPTTTQNVDQAEPFQANQYSVTEQSRKINHATGSNGVAGIYFKYDLEPVSVNVREERRSFGRFLVRLCGIAGGIFATTGMLHQSISSLFSIRRSAAPLPRTSDVAK